MGTYGESRPKTVFAEWTDDANRLSNQQGAPEKPSKSERGFAPYINREIEIERLPRCSPAGAGARSDALKKDSPLSPSGEVVTCPSPERRHLGRAPDPTP